MTPKISVIGVYRLSLQNFELRKQLRRFYTNGNAHTESDESVVQFLAVMEPLVLFDVTVDGVDDRFWIGGFTQEMPMARMRLGKLPMMRLC